MALMYLKELSIRPKEDGARCGIEWQGRHGTLICVEGYNLGSHDLRGFKCDFTGYKPCRMCEAALDQIRQGGEVNDLRS